MATELSTWELCGSDDPTWSLVPMDFPMFGHTGRWCFPPFLLLTLDGVTKVPLNLRGGKGIEGHSQPSSCLTVAFDDENRIFVTSPKDRQIALRKVLKIQEDLPFPPATPQEAYLKNAKGRPSAGGARKDRASTRAK